MDVRSLSVKAVRNTGSKISFHAFMIWSNQCLYNPWLFYCQWCFILFFLILNVTFLWSIEFPHVLWMHSSSAQCQVILFYCIFLHMQISLYIAPFLMGRKAHELWFWAMILFCRCTKLLCEFQSCNVLGQRSYCILWGISWLFFVCFFYVVEICC